MLFYHNVSLGCNIQLSITDRTSTHFTYGTGFELSAGGELSVTHGDLYSDHVSEG